MNGDELELGVAWQQHVSSSAAGLLWFDSVLGRHREPHRHYHVVRHVRWVVRHALELVGQCDVHDVGAIVAAAFFHDAIYLPGDSDNESASAALAAEALEQLGWASDRIDRVAALIKATGIKATGIKATAIEATAIHSSTDVDTSVLLAADLGILAAEPSGYADYVRGVRREYSAVGDDDWRTGRAAVLRSFVARDHIYEPAIGLTSWERRARANIAAELAGLVGEGLRSGELHEHDAEPGP